MRHFAFFVSLASTVVAFTAAGCSGSGSSTGGDSGMPLFHVDGGTVGHDSGGTVTHDTGTVTHDTGTVTHDSGGGGTLFPAGTICNDTGNARTPPATLKHVILIMEENKNLSDVNGNASAPYMTSIAKKCGYTTNFLDNMYAENLDSLPHYLSLTSGSNCDTGTDKSGTGCVTMDERRPQGTSSRPGRSSPR